MLACSTILASTLGATIADSRTYDEITFTQAGCGCKKRPIISPKPGADDNVAFTVAGCPCRNKRPPVPVPQTNDENSISFVQAGGCCDKRNRRERVNADVTILPVGCGCQKKKGNNDERVQRNPLPIEKENRIYGKMAEMALKNRQFVGGKNAPDSPSEANLQAKGLCWFGSSSSSYPAFTHFVRETDVQGSIVTIQDGSVWRVSDEDQYIVKKWSSRAEVAIKPNSLSFWNKLTGSRPSYKYRLVNQYTGESVAANLSLGPFKYNPNTRKIDRIDYYQGEVYLNNGTIWKVDLSGPCSEILRDWQQGQAIICGSNDTWFSLGNPFILISVEKDNWLPATRIF